LDRNGCCIDDGAEVNAMPNRPEELASKAAGAMKAAKATVKGLHGVFKKLTEEHGEVSALLTRVNSTSDPETRSRLFPDIRRDLLAHETGERRAVYPAFRKYPELAGMVDEHEAEATQLERALSQLAATDCADASWGTMFEQLVKLVKHHTGEEENRYFPEASRVLGKEESERLEAAYLAAKVAPIS
jgi:hemerythrin superfamily protein